MKKTKFKLGQKVWVVYELKEGLIRGEINSIDVPKLNNLNYEYDILCPKSNFLLPGVPEYVIGKTKKEALKLYEEIWKGTESWRSKEVTKKILKSAKKNILR